MKLDKVSSLEVKRRIILDSPCFSLKYSHEDPQILVVSNEDGEILVCNVFDPVDDGVAELPEYFTAQPVNSLNPSAQCNPRDYRILKPRTVWQGHYNSIFDIDFVQGNCLVTASGDMTCALWDIERRAAIKHFIGHQKSVRAVRSMPQNPSVIASGGRDGWLLLYDTRENTGKNVLDNQTMADRLMHPIKDCIFTEGGFFVGKNEEGRAKAKNKFAYSKSAHKNSQQHCDVSFLHGEQLCDLRRVQ